MWTPQGCCGRADGKGVDERHRGFGYWLAQGWWQGCTPGGGENLPKECLFFAIRSGCSLCLRGKKKAEKHQFSCLSPSSVVLREFRSRDPTRITVQTFQRAKS